jgi:hypothetical protein
VDSALIHLDRIVADPHQDSAHSMRAAYARAFIQDEFKGKKPISDSLYRYVLEKYPNSEYAKQAERNLGLKPTVQTREDLAHQLFLEAEAARFGGHDLKSEVIPAYAKVANEYPETREAARAEFAIAMSYEQMSQGEEKVPGSLDSAVAAYQVLRERYARSPQGEVAQAKLSAAGIKPPVHAAAAPAAGRTPDAKAPGAAPTPGAPAATAPAATPAVPVSTAPASAPAQAHGGPPGPAQSNPHETVPSPDTPAPAASASDTASAAPEGKTKEILDNGYENVDQY